MDDGQNLLHVYILCSLQSSSETLQTIRLIQTLLHSEEQINETLNWRITPVPWKQTNSNIIKKGIPKHCSNHRSVFKFIKQRCKYCVIFCIIMYIVQLYWFYYNDLFYFLNKYFLYLLFETKREVSKYWFLMSSV